MSPCTDDTGSRPLVVVLGSGGVDPALIGGKATYLHRLLELGAPVPTCGAVAAWTTGCCTTTGAGWAGGACT